MPFKSRLKRLWPKRSLKPAEAEGQEYLSAIREIQSFANLAKNGLHYHAGNDIVFTIIYTGQIIVVDRRDISLAPHLILRGMWEEHLTRACEAFLPRDRPAVIFDVGANFGWYGLVLSRFSPQSQVHFFEANPNLIPLLKRKALVNGLPLRSRINNLAVFYSSETPLTLQIPVMHKGSSSIMEFDTDQSLFHERVDQYDKIEIPSISLDEYAESNAIDNVDFIKVDVEGSEAFVVAGAKDLIKNSPDLVMMLEWSRKRFNSAHLSILQLFKYCYVAVEGRGLLDFSTSLHEANDLKQLEKDITEKVGKDVHHFDVFLSKRALSL
jgi:FkbM family methyltransferase